MPPLFIDSCDGDSSGYYRKRSRHPNQNASGLRPYTRQSLSPQHPSNHRQRNQAHPVILVVELATRLLEHCAPGDLGLRSFRHHHLVRDCKGPARSHLP
ncbi:hypothetical protein MTO96_032522 [Rhipicephalus appendiculatus]